MRKFFTDKKMQSNPWINWFELFSVMLCLWFVLSEIFAMKFVIFGVTVCVTVSFFCLDSMRLAGLKSDRTYFILHADPAGFASYLAWLMKEIVKSALDVSAVVISGRKRTDPHMIWFKADYDNPAARALLANSITLTPGTVTVDMYDDGTYSVHALNAKFAEGLLEGTMQKKIAALYGEEIDYRIIEVINDDHASDKKDVNLLPKRYSAGRRRL